MNKIITILFFLLIGFVSCNKVEKDIKKIKIAEQYYSVLDSSDDTKIMELITTEFTTIDDGLEQKYSQKEYLEWMRWDSVFEPTYKILEIQIKDGIVKAKISKIDKRISFLHQKPIITNEIIQFESNKITNINRTSASFDVDKFIENRDRLSNWISENHPELVGFLNEQTKISGMNYLKAIELYKDKK
ncbi:hypothetical protein [Psychroserpens mesophilus]|uniref:hypothetical protein n=1 Tax=Psychroserpens mesophilus TaxID=325473 RepID=UPI000590E535|nr:hypothetical protein [Psychroserpens mesophilus]